MNNRLRVLRAERGWSQQDLAERLEVSRQSVNAIETGRYDPSLPLAFRIADGGDLAFDAHHAFEFYPMKLQGRERVAGQLAAFSALVIREPNNALRVVAFDEHHTRAGTQIAGNRGEGHRIGLG